MPKDVDDVGATDAADAAFAADAAAGAPKLPRFVMAQIRTTVVLEIRTIAAKNGLEAITASDDEGEIERHVITNDVKPVSDCVGEDKADDQWRGAIIHQYADPKKKVPTEKIAGRTATGPAPLHGGVAARRAGG